MTMTQTALVRKLREEQNDWIEKTFLPKPKAYAGDYTAREDLLYLLEEELIELPDGDCELLLQSQHTLDRWATYYWSRIDMSSYNDQIAELFKSFARRHR